jgi:NTP pyrophosphatase (non-canonical NTP hydrolase)
MMRLGAIPEAMLDIEIEALKATEKYPPFHTAHEGFAVLLEEVNELWDEVKVKQGKRDKAKLRKEAVQVAAMALRFIIDIADNEEDR